MEQIINLITGCLVLRDVDEGEDSDDEGGDDLQWVGYKEVGDLGRGKSLVPYERQKRITGDLIDLQTGRSKGVAGPFHFTDPWWQITILRTKKTRAKLLEPKDYYAFCYRLRDDPRRFTDRVVHLFLSKLQDTLTEEDESGTKINISSWFSAARMEFETFLKQCGQYDDLDLLNLEDRLEAFVSSFPEDEQTESSQQCQLKNAILNSDEFSFIKVAERHPDLLHYVPQLFPGNFKKIISLDEDKLTKLEKVLTDNPGFLAFKAVVSKKCGILGCETSYDALSKSGLLSKVPKDVHDAILMYEFIKKDTKENGHTYVHFSRILDVLGPVVELFEEALEFLNKNKVTKTSVENGERHVFLATLWMAENKIAHGINSLIKQNEKQPWLLEVNWDTEDFESIRQDNDQLLAAKLIANKPVVAISGKGGCGKTYVVTKVITAAKAKRQKQTDNETSFHGDNETQDPDMEDDSYEWKGDYREEKEECPEKIELLLTAPTGKAANLLGKRAKCPSFTLHQVIYSYRNKKHDMPWKHENVNTLVVDECSLVSVSTFSFLIELLQENAKLRKIILLGDVRQLPSIEPGNFLSDAFNSLSRIGCAVELRNNHRAESKRIVDNATLISKKIYPEFYPEQFCLRKLPYGNPSSSGDDYTSQDISVEVMKLLNHDCLKDHVTSQFISFTRKVCDSINDLCCKRYCDHRTKEFGKNVFRTGDKICCTKNGYVNLYERSHGIMTCRSQAAKRKVEDEESQGGVERTVNDDEGISLLDESGNQSTLNGAPDTTGAGSSTSNKDGPNKTNQIRLCNGEIFYIVEELETNDDTGKMRTFLQLSDKDAEKEFVFWVDKGQLKKACKIKHAWARTIHTFQGSETDNVVYIVGNASWRQNWQHVYTAVTRGRKSVTIIGREDILRNAIKRSEIKRQTSLRKQLLDLLQKSKDFKATQAMQIPSMNVTALHPTLSQIDGVKNKHLYDDSKEPARKTKIGTVAGETTLNNTQVVTDILTSLACEHDEENSDIDEYDSDDSQSLFTKIKPTQSMSRNSVSFDSNEKFLQKSISGPSVNVEHSQGLRESKFGHLSGGVSKQDMKYCDKNVHNFQHSSADSSDMSSDVIRDCNKDNEAREEKEEEMESQSGPESDDSQSLISPPSTQARTRAKTAQRKLDNYTNENKEAEQFHNTIKIDEGDTDENRKIEGKVKKNTKLSLNRGKMPLSFVGSQRMKTPADVSRNRKYRYSIQDMSSPITPLLNRNNFSPNIGNAQNTSSPLNMSNNSTDIHCHIRSGLSPLTPGYNESFLGNNSVLSDTSMVQSTHKGNVAPLNMNKGRRLSELDTIKEPKSNESVQSQWSEIDESDYLKLADESNIQRSGNISGVNDSDVVANVGAALNSSKTSLKTRLPISSVHKHMKSINATNISTSSQWSEVDEEQLMTLDLEDINRMTFCNQDNNYGNNGETSFDSGNNSKDTSEITMDKSAEQDRQTCNKNVNLESPELFESGSPPSPSILETTPIKPNRKRSHETCGSEGTEVSPLKRSLSQLKF